MSGILYIVSVPIGNLEDITLRALRILKEVDLIAAEDTRHTRKLLNHYDIHKPTVSYHEYNETQMDKLLITKLTEGTNIALVSDSGTPVISDPGYTIVNACIKEGIKIVPIPGPSSLLASVVISGFPLHNFVYEGFLPPKKMRRIKKLISLSDEKRTMVFFETPHRLIKSLNDLLEIFGDREIVIANDLTKMFEEIYRGSISRAIKKYSESKPKGEFTLVVRGKPDDGIQED
ncbi:MAG: 16S rRNA (cytidine(1402)-2'-O)-methyltransferase [Candidatus Poribacteria bacterium]